MCSSVTYWNRVYLLIALSCSNHRSFARSFVWLGVWTSLFLSENMQKKNWIVCHLIWCRCGCYFRFLLFTITKLHAINSLCHTECNFVSLTIFDCSIYKFLSLFFPAYCIECTHCTNDLIRIYIQIYFHRFNTNSGVYHLCLRIDYYHLTGEK